MRSTRIDPHETLILTDCELSYDRKHHLPLSTSVLEKSGMFHSLIGDILLIYNCLFLGVLHRLDHDL